MNGKGYIIRLEGQGDLDIKVVGQTTWDWINSDSPDAAGSSWDETDPVSGKKIRVTVGSPDNDRAIQCEAVKEGFDSSAEARRYIQSLGWKFGNYYVGRIY